MGKRLWAWFSTVVAVFAAATFAIMLSCEHRYKKEILSARLEGYADIVASASDDLERTVELLPDSIRVSVLDFEGRVIYDSLEEADSLANHLERPEIRQALEAGQGYGLRMSETAGRKYFYYARRYEDEVVRTALPFEVQQSRFFRPSALLIWMLIVLLVAALGAAMVISRRFGREAADSLQDQKRKMTNNIAHELRTPVTSIRGYLETLSTGPEMSEERRKMFIDRAYAQSLRLSELIRDISLVTKIEEAPEMLKVEMLDCSQIVREVLEEFAGKIAEGHFRVSNSVPDGLMVRGNQTLIYSIFRNLVENTLKYAGEGAEISISSLPRDGGHVSFRYYDTGKGVDEEYLDRIFERFYRIPSSESDEGSGLGLSIVRNAVAFHGGSIHVSPLMPHGLCFEFEI